MLFGCVIGLVDTEFRPDRLQFVPYIGQTIPEINVNLFAHLSAEVLDVPAIDLPLDKFELLLKRIERYLNVSYPLLIALNVHFICFLIGINF